MRNGLRTKGRGKTTKRSGRRNMRVWHAVLPGRDTIRPAEDIPARVPGAPRGGGLLFSLMLRYGAFGFCNEIFDQSVNELSRSDSVKAHARGESFLRSTASMFQFRQ